MIKVSDLVEEDFGITGNDRWMRSEVHSSLVVDDEKDIFFFNARGISGNALTYLIKVRGLDVRSAQELLKHPTAGNPTDTGDTGLQVKFEKLVDLFHGAGRADRRYWYDRKLTDSTIDRFRLGNFDGWNLIPIYDKGLFCNFQCRRDKPNKRIRFWYKDDDFVPVLFNKEVLPFVDSIYITEGMVDCILLNQLGLPSVCSTNGALSWNPGWIQHFTKMKSIVYIADNDPAGVTGAYLVAKSIGLYKVKILRFKEKALKYGALNFFLEDGTVEQLKEIIEERCTYGFEKELI